jgi:hypothetical protein
MNHFAGGPATDHFDMLQALEDWVEKGVAPDSVRATVNAADPDVVAAGWRATRSRPLCAYPKQALRKAGATNTENATSFECRWRQRLQVLSGRSANGGKRLLQAKGRLPSRHSGLTPCGRPESFKLSRQMSRRTGWPSFELSTPHIHKAVCRWKLRIAMADLSVPCPSADRTGHTALGTRHAVPPCCGRVPTVA